MSVQPTESNGVPLVRMENITRRFGTITALEDVSFEVGYQEIVGLLGDNGAGKSTLIKVLTGVHPATSGQIYFEGQPVSMTSPQDARDLGIETVYQDLALVPLISISRNFYLGREPVEQIGPVPVLDKATMDRNTTQALDHIGIRIRGASEPVGTLSGGERQSIAIGRAVHFGTKLLILDEPTSALSIGETRKVIGYTLEAKKRGLSVIFITHNIHHVFEVADRFTIISHGHKVGDFRSDEVTQEEVAGMIMGEPVPQHLRNRVLPLVPTRPIELNSAPKTSANGTAVAPARPMTAQQRADAKRTRARLLFVAVALVVALLLGAAYLYSRPQTTESSGVPALVRTEYGNGFSFKLPESWLVDRAESQNKHAQNAQKDFVMIMLWDSLRNKGIGSSTPLSKVAEQMQQDDLFGREYKTGSDITIGGRPAYRFEWVNNGSKRSGVDFIFIGTDNNFYNVTFDAPIATWESELKPLADAIMASFEFQ
jgi:simple sugar transport system ATP-binding protein